MGKFDNVALMIVDRETGLASNCGWASDCKSMLITAFPGLPNEVFESPSIKKMMEEVDDVTGELYVWEYIPYQHLWANSTLEKLLSEVPRD